MDTAICPQCHQTVDAQAVTCPYCRKPLKAHGHPGIPLHWATGEAPLCQSCTYNADDSCTFPQRPYARECILYQDMSQHQADVEQYHRRWASPLNWFKQRQALLVLLGILAVAFLFALNNHPQLKLHHNVTPTPTYQH